MALAGLGEGISLQPSLVPSGSQSKSTLGTPPPLARLLLTLQPSPRFLHAEVSQRGETSRTGLQEGCKKPLGTDKLSPGAMACTERDVCCRCGSWLGL